MGLDAYNMEAAMCEVCEQRPAKMICEDCGVALCPKDVKQHKEDMPDCPLHIVLLKPGSSDSHAVASLLISSSPPILVQTEDRLGICEVAGKLQGSEVGDFQPPPLIEDAHDSTPTITSPTEVIIENPKEQPQIPARIEESDALARSIKMAKDDFISSGKEPENPAGKEAALSEIPTAEMSVY